MIEIFILAITVPFLTQHRNVVPSNEVTTNFYGSVTGIVNEAYIQSHGGGGIDTNAVREIAGEVVAPVETAVADRYTKAEADGRFVPNGHFNVSSDWMPMWNNEPLFYWDIGDSWYINPNRMKIGWRGVHDTPTTLSGYGITDGATTNDLESGLSEKRGVDDNICHKTEAYWVGEYEGQKYTFRYGMSYLGVECWNADGVALFKRIGSDVTKDDLCPEDWTGTAYVGIAWASSGNVADRRVEAVEGEPYITRSGLPEQARSDWDQSDESKPDFIKNKPSVYTQSEIDWKFSDIADVTGSRITYGKDNKFTRILGSSLDISSETYANKSIYVNASLAPLRPEKLYFRNVGNKTIIDIIRDEITNDVVSARSLVHGYYFFTNETISVSLPSMPTVGNPVTVGIDTVSTDDGSTYMHSPSGTEVFLGKCTTPKVFIATEVNDEAQNLRYTITADDGRFFFTPTRAINQED